MIILAIVIFLFLVYSSLVLYYFILWKKIPDFKSDLRIPAVSFSLIIPARNEEKNIKRLLESIQAIDYPSELIEVIVVDDHSTDSTADNVKGFSAVKLVQLQGENINSYKKKAIDTGIEHAK